MTEFIDEDVCPKLRLEKVVSKLASEDSGATSVQMTLRSQAPRSRTEDSPPLFVREVHFDGVGVVLEVGKLDKRCRVEMWRGGGRLG